MCFWIFHTWGRWTDRLNLKLSYGEVLIQERECISCGLKQIRKVATDYLND